MRDELYREQSVEQTIHIIKSVKVAKETVKVCDCCNKPLEQIVTYGKVIVCSVECGYEVSGNTPHIESESILDKVPKRERPDDIYGI